MQAIILAAGESSRFRPLSEGKHKSLLKLAGKTLIEWTVESVLKGGADDVIIISAPRDESKFRKIVSSNKYKKKVKVVIQEDPKGMGNADNWLIVTSFC